jgi:oxepin-CoA hydrolase/3-oxo-5,6-dehydrosuberyl-CoA semialdehyde dehydrogenase
MSFKEQFVCAGLLDHLSNLKADTPAKWGKMNAQQMVEHLATFFDVSSGKLIYDLLTPAEQLPRYREFLHSEKQFRENTRAPLEVMGEEPMPVKYGSFEDAVSALRKSIDNFQEKFREDPTAKTIHPVFGPLDYSDWVQLHHKHCSHHLRQFGLDC